MRKKLKKKKILTRGARGVCSFEGKFEGKISYLRSDVDCYHYLQSVLSFIPFLYFPFRLENRIPTVRRAQLGPPSFRFALLSADLLIRLRNIRQVSKV